MYDDHHAAVAFSILEAVVKDKLFKEKQRAEKSRPDMGDILENKVSHLSLVTACIDEIFCRSG